jgi:Protein of unknown function (DUF3224)
MPHPPRFRNVIIGVASLACFGGTAVAQERSLTGAQSKEAVVTGEVAGTFDVKLVPQPTAWAAGDSTFSRMSIEKQFHGGLEGTSRGEMLAATTGTEGSAGYVAIEEVTATLDGRRGTFVLQHSGTMDRGVPQLSVTVVPDSGTEELVGLSGRMTITIEGGKHSYAFQYAIGRR